MTDVLSLETQSKSARARPNITLTTTARKWDARITRSADGCQEAEPRVSERWRLDITPDRGHAQCPMCTKVSQQCEGDEEHCRKRRVGEELTLHAHALQALVVHHRGGSTHVHIEIDPDAFADPAPSQPDKASHDAGQDHIGQRRPLASNRLLQRCLPDQSPRAVMRRLPGACSIRRVWRPLR
jgi:hypothetical protein